MIKRTYTKKQLLAIVLKIEHYVTTSFFLILNGIMKLKMNDRKLETFLACLISFEESDISM